MREGAVSGMALGAIQSLMGGRVQSVQRNEQPPGLIEGSGALAQELQLLVTDGAVGLHGSLLGCQSGNRKGEGHSQEGEPPEWAGPGPCDLRDAPFRCHASNPYFASRFLI
jgi:hypothetical protein